MYFKHIHKLVFLLAAFLVITGLQGTSVFSAEEKAEEQKELKFTEKMAAILFQEADEPFIYKREGRTDPFQPFIREKVVVTKTPV